jgi:[ribosomal protein S5]-alanine N-acetyltransferase
MLSFNFAPFPILFTDRLALKELTIEDAIDMFLLRSDKEVMRFIDRPLATSAEDGLLWIQKVQEGILNNDAVTWGIALKNDSSIIGTIGFWRIMKEHHRAEIGYMIGAPYQRKGFMQEAIEKVLWFGFGSMRLHSVEANVNPNNLASIKLLEKNGFVKEAHFKENYFAHGKFLDSAIYSLLRPAVSGLQALGGAPDHEV